MAEWSSFGRCQLDDADLARGISLICALPHKTNDRYPDFWARQSPEVPPKSLLLCFSALVALISALCRSISNVVTVAQTQSVTNHINEVIHAKSIRVDLECYENSDYHDMLHRVQQEAPYRPIRIVQGLTHAGQSGISLLAMAGLLLSFNWLIATALFLTAIPGLLVRMKYAAEVFDWTCNVTKTMRRGWYFNEVLTRNTHAKEIRVYGLGSLFAKMYSSLCEQLRNARVKIAIRHSTSEFAAELGATLALFGSYAFVVYRAVQGLISLGDVVMFFQAFQRGLAALQQAFVALSNLYEDNLFLSSLDEFLSLEPRIAEPKHPRLVPRPMRSSISFNNVSFAYPNSEKRVVEEVTFTLAPGEIVALVGENGSGKSTLIKLLCRLYDPTSGSISIDGTDIREFETVALRREIGIIFQDYARYNMTARENIWYGNIDIEPDQDAVVAAARYSGAHEVIAKLPNSYDTVLGKYFENGEDLSIGQWQKLALARAFLREAQVIILDEPTSSIDPNAEYEFFKSFRELAAGRSAIIISHRFSTVRMADCIYVMDKGRIIERGTHDELIQRGQTYMHLFEKQAQYYR